MATCRCRWADRPPVLREWRRRWDSSSASAGDIPVVVPHPDHHRAVCRLGLDRSSRRHPSPAVYAEARVLDLVDRRAETPRAIRMSLPFSARGEPAKPIAISLVAASLLAASRTVNAGQTVHVGPRQRQAAAGHSTKRAIGGATPAGTAPDRRPGSCARDLAAGVEHFDHRQQQHRGDRQADEQLDEREAGRRRAGRLRVTLIDA